MRPEPSPGGKGYIPKEAPPKRTKGYIAKEAPLGFPLTPKGYIDKAAKITCARDRPKRTFFDGHFKSKVKEKSPAQIFGRRRARDYGNRPKGASLRKCRPLLTYPWGWEAKLAEGYIAKEVPLGLSLVPKR